MEMESIGLYVTFFELAPDADQGLPFHAELRADKWIFKCPTH